MNTRVQKILVKLTIVLLVSEFLRNRSRSQQLHVGHAGHDSEMGVSGMKGLESNDLPLYDQKKYQLVV
jgi:hypothetical protein